MHETTQYTVCPYNAHYLAVVMKIKNVGEVDDPKYHISNIVIPNTYLEVTSAKLTGDDYQVRFLYVSHQQSNPQQIIIQNVCFEN